MSVLPSHLCNPCFGVATHPPAARLSSDSLSCFLSGHTKLLLCASINTFWSVTATAPIVVCINTQLECAIELAKSINCNFLSSLSNRRVSCKLYSKNVLKSSLYNSSSVPSYCNLVSPNSASAIEFNA